jgi:CRISPR type IV-associated DEAD/DEAH-box helicase Csf4
MADKQAPAEQDLLLTDLYIPRLPYGCHRTLTHRRRVAALGFMVEVHETARMLKQGVGRLVRREGLRDRHIWLADSRLTQPRPHLKPILKLLSAFRQRPFTRAEQSRRSNAPQYLEAGQGEL